MAEADAGEAGSPPPPRMQLHVWKAEWNLQSANPECLQAIAYVRFSRAPVDVVYSSNPKLSPTGQLPVLCDEEGELVAGVENVIDALRARGFNADFRLTPLQGADTLALAALVREHVLPAILYNWWMEAENFDHITRHWHSSALPFPLSWFLPSRMKEAIVERFESLAPVPLVISQKPGGAHESSALPSSSSSSASASATAAAASDGSAGAKRASGGKAKKKKGVGRGGVGGKDEAASREADDMAGVSEILYANANECFRLLSQRLGGPDGGSTAAAAAAAAAAGGERKKVYFFGDAPSTLDAVVFGALACILSAPMRNNALKAALQKHSNLVDYCGHVRKTLADAALAAGASVGGGTSAPVDEFETAAFKVWRWASITFGLVSLVAYPLLSGMIAIEFSDDTDDDDDDDDDDGRYSPRYGGGSTAGGSRGQQGWADSEDEDDGDDDDDDDEYDYDYDYANDYEGNGERGVHVPGPDALGSLGGLHMGRGGPFERGPPPTNFDFTFVGDDDDEEDLLGED